MPISLEREIYEYSPGEITPRTRKRQLENVDLSFQGEPTQYATHSLHPYVAAINPPLARKLIETYVPQNGSILDPFCGGGGVLVESMLSERHCAGFDINPLGVMISKAKTTQISREEIQSQYERIITKAQSLTGQVNPQISDWAKYWFREDSLPELAALSVAIRECEKEELRTLFNVIFSITVRSVMLTYRGEIRLRRLTDQDLDKFKPVVFDAFTQHYQSALMLVPDFPTNCIARVELADARELPVKDEQYHSIICSPPYADDTNGVGYFQFSRYMLEWLGMPTDAINFQKSRFLGGTKSGKVMPPSMTLQIAASKVRERNKKHYQDALAFYADYYQALIEMKRVVTDWIIIVIGNRVLSRTLFDNANITLELYNSSADVELVDYYSRTIRKKRIPNLGGDGGGINVEHILIFRKK